MKSELAAKLITEFKAAAKQCGDVDASNCITMSRAQAEVSLEIYVPNRLLND